MCGIVGYVGNSEASSVILDGLRRLEYRGYDSAGLAIGSGDREFVVRRAAGKLRNLEEAVRLNPAPGNYGIGHTRWATHGRPTRENAHPHRDESGDVVVVHNGIIENYVALKESLESEGHSFSTDTDSEIIAHLIAKYSNSGQALEEATRRTVLEIQGLFALATISRRDPGKIVGARLGPPVVVGLGDGEYFLASDTPSILNHTRDMLILDDGDIAVISANGVRVMDFDGQPITRPVQRILWDPVVAEKSGYKHFMLKEIYEQRRSIRETTLGRVDRASGGIFLEEMDITQAELQAIQQVRIVGCGTSWHAGLAGKFMIEQLARVNVEVDYGSEFRYRNPVLDEKVLSIFVSQSGETADTLAAQREAKRQGSKTVAICNVVDSMLTRESSGTVYTHSGPEISVASTKAFTSQLTAMYLFALHLAQARERISVAQSRKCTEGLLKLPGLVEQALETSDQCEQIARSIYHADDLLYLGRGIHFPIALEGALKLKEISYIHAEGYPAGEMKHGPNALIDEDLPVVVIATSDPDDESSCIRYEKTLANIEEVAARRGRLICVANEGDSRITSIVDDVIAVPATDELLSPIVEIIPLQLIAYHVAVLRGCDVDQPRNLAKSVTVE